MPRRPSKLADQFVNPPEIEALVGKYASSHTTEQIAAYVQGICDIFGIVEEMLFAKMKDGSRWTETQERAFQQIDNFIFEKREIVERWKADYQSADNTPKPGV